MATTAKTEYLKALRGAVAHVLAGAWSSPVAKWLIIMGTIYLVLEPVSSSIARRIDADTADAKVVREKMVAGEWMPRNLDEKPSADPPPVD